jgi:hypothetical protein
MPYGAYQACLQCRHCGQLKPTSLGLLTCLYSPDSQHHYELTFMPIAGEGLFATLFGLLPDRLNFKVQGKRK